MNKPLVSVLMPAYKCEKYIRRAIDSILNQTYTNIELLVADDASKDQTRKIIDSFTDPRIKRFHNGTNQGYLKTCNKLFGEVTGQYITFQDADDFSDLRRIEIQLQAFDADPELGACGTDFISLNDKGIEFKRTDFPATHDEIMRSISKGVFCVIPNSFLFKREILDTVGGYNEFFDRIGAEDYYWTWLIMEKYKLENLKQCLYFYQYNQNSVTGNLSTNYKKIFSVDIVSFLISQRLTSRNDGLSDLSLKSDLCAFVEEQERPFLADPSYLFVFLARKDFYGNRKERAVRYMLKAIVQKPFRSSYYRDLLYYLRN